MLINVKMFIYIILLLLKNYFYLYDAVRVSYSNYRQGTDTHSGEVSAEEDEDQDGTFKSLLFGP